MYGGVEVTILGSGFSGILPSLARETLIYSWPNLYVRRRTGCVNALLEFYHFSVRVATFSKFGAGRRNIQGTSQQPFRHRRRASESFHIYQW